MITMMIDDDDDDDDDDAPEQCTSTGSACSRYRAIITAPLRIVDTW
jgi:hypothetical protein